MGGKGDTSVTRTTIATDLHVTVATPCLAAPADGPRDIPALADRLLELSRGRRPITIGVGLPLCSDGEVIRFGSGLYDPFEEKTLLEMPTRISDAAEADLDAARNLVNRLRACAGAQSAPLALTLTIFNAKMVHGLGKAKSRRVQAAVAGDPETYLPLPALALRDSLGGDLGLDFSLEYRRLGVRFVTRLRKAVAPSVRSVPSFRLPAIFRRSGILLLKQIDVAKPCGGIGRILAATPSAVAPPSPVAHALDGREEVRRVGAIPLSNSSGNHICEVTAVGRMLAMLSRAPAAPPGARPILLSLLNVCDAGNWKIDRMSWGAGELVAAASPVLAHGPAVAGSDPLTHLTSASDGDCSFLTDSRLDERLRSDFVESLAHRVSTARSERHAEDILAGAIDSVRARVHGSAEAGVETVLLHGPGDWNRG
jgi:hypothetical protein